MSAYERSTTVTNLGSLPEPVRARLLERIEASQLTLPPDAPAFLTRSRRLAKPGLFGRRKGGGDQGPEQVTALVVGPRDVLVATQDDGHGTAVLVARLEDVEVGSPLDDLPATGGGVTVTGFPVASDGGGTGRGSYFVGLGAPDGDAARAALEAAVRAAKA